MLDIRRHVLDNFLDRAIKENTDILDFEVDKDKTDFELTLEYLKNNDYKNITIIGEGVLSENRRSFVL